MAQHATIQSMWALRNVLHLTCGFLVHGAVEHGDFVVLARLQRATLDWLQPHEPGVCRRGRQ
eukprot:10958251-Lingulodinium_polyedra.AAC.1